MATLKANASKKVSKLITFDGGGFRVYFPFDGKLVIASDPLGLESAAHAVENDTPAL